MRVLREVGFDYPPRKPRTNRSHKNTHRLTARERAYGIIGRLNLTAASAHGAAILLHEIETALQAHAREAVARLKRRTTP